MTNANAAEDAAREVVESNAQADERQVPGAEYVAKLRGHGPEHGPLSEDVAANADAERAYEERLAQKEDRVLCRCGDQQAAHSGAPVGMTRGCMVEACPCTKFRASGDNLEQSLEAMDDSDEAGELTSWRLLGWEMAPRMHDLLHRERGMDALERDVVALPPDGSPQQRWLAEAQAIAHALAIVAESDPQGEIPTVVGDLRVHLDTMPAPFDWDAVGQELYIAGFTRIVEGGDDEGAGPTLKRLWLGGAHAGD